MKNVNVMKWNLILRHVQTTQVNHFITYIFLGPYDVMNQEWNLSTRNDPFSYFAHYIFHYISYYKFHNIFHYIFFL